MEYIFHCLKRTFQSMEYTFQTLERNFHSAKITIIALSYNYFSVIFQKCYNIVVFGGVILDVLKEKISLKGLQKDTKDKQWNNFQEITIKKFSSDVVHPFLPLVFVL